MIASPLSSQSFAVLFFSQPNGWRFPIRFRSNAVALEGQRRQPLEIVPFLVQLHLWHLDEGRWWAAEEDAFWRWGEIWFDVKRVADLTDVFFLHFRKLYPQQGRWYQNRWMKKNIGDSPGWNATIFSGAKSTSLMFYFQVVKFGCFLFFQTRIHSRKRGGGMEGCFCWSPALLQNIHTVDGWNPARKPPGECIKPAVNNGIKLPTSTG